MLQSRFDRWLTTDPRYERRSYGDPLDDGDIAYERKRDRRWDEDEELDTDVRF